MTKSVVMNLSSNDEWKVPWVSSSGATYELMRKGNVFSCTCPAWRNQKKPIQARTCKHLKAYLGVGEEERRTQSQTPPSSEEIWVNGALNPSIGAAVSQGVGRARLAMDWTQGDPARLRNLLKLNVVVPLLDQYGLNTELEIPGSLYDEVTITSVVKIDNGQTVIVIRVTCEKMGGANNVFPAQRKRPILLAKAPLAKPPPGPRLDLEPERKVKENPVVDSVYDRGRALDLDDDD